MGIKKKIQKKIVDIEQRMLKRKYEQEGLTDDVLEKQVRINTKKHELNLNEKEFVQ